jgi:hypothetical protein
MVKKKSKAVILAADGAGGMVQVQDRRFERSNWPLNLAVSPQEADKWLAYLFAECTKRNWSCSTFGQAEARENSGTITIRSPVAEEPTLTIVWERQRGGPLKLRVRYENAADFPLALAEELFQRVTERCRANETEKFYLRGQLEYEGLPCLGEFWLSDELRLGPPSRHDEGALLSKRVVLVDVLLDAIDRLDAATQFPVLLREISVFLSVVLGTNVRVPSSGTRAWTWSIEEGGAPVCALRDVGYVERDHPAEMPIMGAARAMPKYAVQRPDFSLRGIRLGDNEKQLPSDILDLWRRFAALPADRRRQFLQVGSIWQLALFISREYQTTRFALMVAAIEALKPPSPQFRSANIYDVVEALLGKAVAERLQEHWFRPQDIRNAHLHGGDLRGAEFAASTFLSSFQDPTFGEATRILAQVTQAAIIEWLAQSGTSAMRPPERRRRHVKWMREHLLIEAALILGVGVTLGMILRRRGRAF